MELHEMRNHIEQRIHRQGTAATKAIALLFTAMRANSKARFIKCHNWYFSNVAMTSAFLGAAAEVIGLNADSSTGELKVGDCTKLFSGCSKLQQVVGIISLASLSKLANAFDDCSKLISIKLKGISQSIDLSSCVQISPESVLYMVQNAVAHSIIVIKHRQLQF